MTMYTLFGKLGLKGSLRDAAFSNPSTAGLSHEEIELMNKLLTLTAGELQQLKHCLDEAGHICCQKWPCN